MNSCVPCRPLAAVLCCVMTMAVFTECVNDSGDNPVNPTPSDDGTIVGNWCSDVSGLTYAKWNYDKTWQNTEFKALTPWKTCQASTRLKRFSKPQPVA